MLAMLPPPRAAIFGASAPTRKYGAWTLAANSRSKVATSRSAVGPNHENPALLTSTSTVPARSTRSFSWARSVRSAATNRALPPAAVMESITAEPRAASRPCTTTSAPCRPSFSAAARRMPDLTQVAQDGRGCPGPGLDGGFGVEGAEVITGEMDTCCRASEGCLDAAPAGEAVCEAERPPAYLRFNHEPGRSGKDLLQVVEITVDDLAVVEIEQRRGERGVREDHEAAARLARLLTRTDDAGGIQEDVECSFRCRDRVAAVPRLRSALIG